MKHIAIYILTGLLTASLNPCLALKKKEGAEKFFSATNKNIQYTGRIDFSLPGKPKFWQPGVYIAAKFRGSSCRFILNDEMLGGKSHNYIEVVVDDTLLYRLQTKSATDTIDVAKNLHAGTHTITICKNTEANIGYIEFVGFLCEKLLPLPPKPKRRLEFVGNSITCGTGSDLSEVPCGKGRWEDQHNAYMSYGPVVSRKLNAQWHLSAVSGIGLMHSCCKLEITMPDVFDKVSMRRNEIQWDFKNYQPDAITICLGQNDGVQDSTAFCERYVTFIQKIRSYYPATKVVCLTSPMGDEKLTAVLKNYLSGIVEYENRQGDKNVSRYFFSRQYHNGCDGHPDLAEHRQIAEELFVYLSELLQWKS